MHFTKAFALMSTLLTFGLASPTSQALEQHDNEADMLYTRDVQAANVVLIEDTLSQTGYDVHSKRNITEEELASLSPDDAQVLSVELNKFAVNHKYDGKLIPAFSNKQFNAEAAAVKKQAAAKAQARSSDLAVYEDQGADAGALIEARGAQFLSIFFHIFGLIVWYAIGIFG